MIAGIKILRGSIVSIKKNDLVIDDGSSRIFFSFEDIETIEAMENNLGLIAIKKRTEATLREGVENDVRQGHNRM